MPISSHCFWPCARMPAGASRRRGQPDRLQRLLPPPSGTPRAAAQQRPARRVRRRPRCRGSAARSAPRTPPAVWKVRPTPSRAIWCTCRPSSSWPPNRDRAGRLDQPGDRVDEVVLPAPLGPIRNRRSPGSTRQVDPVDGHEAVEDHAQSVGPRGSRLDAHPLAPSDGRSPAPVDGSGRSAPRPAPGSDGQAARQERDHDARTTRPGSRSRRRGTRSDRLVCA